jgi:hypothetical protein
LYEWRTGDRPEVAIAEDAWQGTGLGGVRFVGRGEPIGHKLLTFDQVKQREGDDRRALLEKQLLVAMSDEQLYMREEGWELIAWDCSDEDLWYDHGWGTQPGPGSKGRGGENIFKFVNFGEQGAESEVLGAGEPVQASEEKTRRVQGQGGPVRAVTVQDQATSPGPASGLQAATEAPRKGSFSSVQSEQYQVKKEEAEAVQGAKEDAPPAQTVGSPREQGEGGETRE